MKRLKAEVEEANQANERQALKDAEMHDGADGPLLLFPEQVSSPCSSKTAFFVTGAGREKGSGGKRA